MTFGFVPAMLLKLCLLWTSNMFVGLACGENGPLLLFKRLLNISEVPCCNDISSLPFSLASSNRSDWSFDLVASPLAVTKFMMPPFCIYSWAFWFSFVFADLRVLLSFMALSSSSECFSMQLGSCMCLFSSEKRAKGADAAGVLMDLKVLLRLESGPGKGGSSSNFAGRLSTLFIA